MTALHGGNSRFWNCGALLALWLVALCFPAAGASLSASVDRPVIALGETVTFSLTFEGVQVGQPRLPAIPNFQVVGQGSSLNMDLNRGISQQTFTYQLAPAAVGDFTIPGLQFNAGGQVLQSQPIAIKVIRPGDPAAVGQAPPALVKLVVPKKQLYVGEVSEVEVQVFFQEGRITQYPALPVDSGITAGKWNKQPTESRVNISNQVFAVYSFKQPITPVKAGLVTVGPASASVLIPDKTRRPDFFFGRPEKELRLATEQATIQVLPLPEQNVPTTFAGAVGNFTATLSATPTNVAAGDPVTVRIKIAGRGALDAVRLPPQPDWKEFKLYPPTAQVESADPNNISGIKTFEQVVVPERAGIQALPSFAFSFFDAEQKIFRTITTPAVPLSVSAHGGSSVAMPNLPGTTNGSPTQTTSELAHIKVHVGAATSGSVLIRQPWFIGLQVLPPVAWLGLVVIRKQRQRLANDPRQRRRVEVAKKIREGMTELNQHAANKNSDAFFAGVMRLLQEQIGERINAPANAITEAVIEERLRPAGAPATTCDSAHKLFQACNLARYAPAQTREELSKLLPELQQTLSDLQRWEPRP